MANHRAGTSESSDRKGGRVADWERLGVHREYKGDLRR